MYDKFHGDLHFDNIIYNSKSKKFTYIDWRESFSGNVNGGDLYYDLSKLYAGCLFPFILFNDKSKLKLFENNIFIKK